MLRIMSGYFTTLSGHRNTIYQFICEFLNRLSTNTHYYFTTCRVVAADIDDSRRELAKRMGADVTLNPKTVDMKQVR